VGSFQKINMLGDILMVQIHEWCPEIQKKHTLSVWANDGAIGRFVLMKLIFAAMKNAIWVCDRITGGCQNW